MKIPQNNNYDLDVVIKNSDTQPKEKLIV